MSTFRARALRFKQWLTNPLGRYVLAQERRYLRRLLRELGGYQVLCVSTSNHSFFERSLAFNKVSLNCTTSSSDERASTIVADIEAWPIANESVNVLLLHHVLDFVENPHELLREANRVLAAGGFMICCNFNPWSLQGLLRLFSVLRPGNHLGLRRLKDWFKLLGFSVKAEQFLLYRTGHHSLEIKLQNHAWPLGGVYVLTTRKMALNMLSMQTGWKKSKTKLVAIASASAGTYKKPDA